MHLSGFIYNFFDRSEETARTCRLVWALIVYRCDLRKSDILDHSIYFSGKLVLSQFLEKLSRINECMHRCTSNDPTTLFKSHVAEGFVNP